jgi:diguanylate cyclase (GGDEF)-like protein
MDDRLLARKTAHNQVLVVDDDPTIVRLLATWLDLAGYVVLKANDGEQALELIEQECPDFLLTDWEMPRIDGPTLCRIVRDMHLPHYMYVVFLTSRKSRDDIIGALDAGADDYLCKPVQKSELLARMLAGGRVLDLERKLSLMARSDVLTGLYTRRVFFEYFEKELQRAQRHASALSCVMFDIDYFKRINDQHGHAVGDVCLQTVARLLTENCRSSDVVCRFAGDEFLAMLPDTDSHKAVAWAERLRQNMGKSPLRIGETEIQIAATFGVAQRDEETQSTKELLDCADQALLLAKQAGRNRVQAFDRSSGTGKSQNETTAQVDVFGSATALDVMVPCDVHLHRETQVGEAVDPLLKQRSLSVPVVDDDGNLCGVLCESDLMEVAAFPERWSSVVHELMTTNFVKFDSTEPARSVYAYLSRGSVQNAVVVQDECPVGCVGLASLMCWVGRTAKGSPGAIVLQPGDAPIDESASHLPG